MYGFRPYRREKRRGRKTVGLTMKKNNIIAILAAGATFALACSAMGAASGDKFLADRHAADNGVACADCHDGKENPKEKAGIGACLECHDGYKGMAEATRNLDVNPHDSHEGEIECTECHKPHGKPVDYCEQCHAFGLMVP